MYFKCHKIEHEAKGDVEKYENEKEEILADNRALHKEVNEIEHEYIVKTRNLETEYKELKEELKKDYERKARTIENIYEDGIYKLEKEERQKEKDMGMEL